MHVPPGPPIQAPATAPAHRHSTPRHEGAGDGLFHRVRLAVCLILLAALIEALFACLMGLSLGFLADRVYPKRDLEALYAVLTLLGAGALMSLGAGFLRDVLAARAHSKALSALRESMFVRMQRLAMSFHSPAGDEDVLSRFSTDLAVVESALAVAVRQGVLPALQAVLSTGLIFWVDWRAGLICLTFWPWIFLAPRIVAARAARAADEFRDHESGVLGIVKETFRALALVRALSLEQAGVAGFRKRNAALAVSMSRAGLRASLVDRLADAGILCIQAALLGTCAWLVFNNHLQVGALATLQVLAILQSAGLRSAFAYLGTVPAAKTAYHRIRETMAAPHGPEDKKDARFLPPLQAEIGFWDVSFSYDGTRDQVSGLTARIPKGSHVAFVGASGAGKSTVFNLLLRFYDPHKGRITIDGHDLRSVTQASLRAHFGLVLQENTLFDVSIAENIRFGNADASEEGILNAAKAAGLYDTIKALPDGFGTPAVESGIGLSAVLLQRMAIARVMVRDPEILLLDEATSALDPVAEAELRETLKTLCKGRTVISLTHRLATTADADHIFVFDEGRVVEHGSHFELLAGNGAYADLWHKQAGFVFSEDGRHVDVDAQRLKQFPILEKLDEEKLAGIAPFFATETFPAGRDIVRQNDQGDKFYIIARGEVDVWRTEEQSGYTRCVATLQDGDFFGEITLMTGFPRTATVRARTVCTCISLERGQFNRLLEGFPDLRKELSDIAVHRLRESSKAVTIHI